MKLYYCDKVENFGDLLNKYIFKKCFNIEIEHADMYNANAIGIGSILENTLWSTKDLKYIFKYIFNKAPLYVLSSGFGWEAAHYKSKLRYLYNMILKRKLIIVALRGEYTKEICRNNLSLDTSNAVLGDMGLLSSYLLDDSSEEKIFDMGICPHYADRNNVIFKKIQEKIPNSIILDTLQSPVDFMKKLSQCKTIISTGLHPLIAADSLGIPNMWVRVSDKTTTLFKFRDYYSVFGENITPYYLINEDITPEFIINNYKINPEIVERVKIRLFNTIKNSVKNI